MPQLGQRMRTKDPCGILLSYISQNLCSFLVFANIMILSENFSVEIS